MGDVVLGEFLRERGLMPSSAPSIDYWVMAADLDAKAVPRVLSIATALRGTGCSVEYAFRPMSFKKQLEAAEKAGAAAVVVIKSGAAPSDELLARVITLSPRSERTLSVSAFLQEQHAHG
jgi:histidyl-tRNA synthetase